MGYNNIRAKIKRWNQHTKKLKYFSSAEFDEHKNKFTKGWSPSYKIITSKNVSNLTTLKNYLSNNPFTKYDIF